MSWPRDAVPTHIQLRPDRQFGFPWAGRNRTGGSASPGAAATGPPWGADARRAPGLAAGRFLLGSAGSTHLVIDPFERSQITIGSFHICWTLKIPLEIFRVLSGLLPRYV